MALVLDFLGNQCLIFHTWSVGDEGGLVMLVATPR
jgi:hypothetical protein